MPSESTERIELSLPAEVLDSICHEEDEAHPRRHTLIYRDPLSWLKGESINRRREESP